MLQIKARTKILALFCAMSFLMYVDRVNLSATAGLIKDELGLSNTELGVIFSAFAYTYAVFQIIGGWFVDRLGSRRMIIFCGIIWVIATMATGFVGGFISLFLARLLLGVGKVRRCLLRRERSPTGSSRSSVALFRALRTHSLVWEMRLLPPLLLH